MRTPLRFATLLTIWAAIALAGACSCRPKYPNCKTDEHCAEKGEVCVEGICRECATDAQCKEGFTCKDNACVALPACRVDTDCGADMRCSRGQCVPECTTNRECASGERCENNRCVAIAECTSDADCTGGGSCREGKCETASTDGGTSDAEAEARRRLEACTLDPVPFEFNEFALSEGARAALDRAVECIKFKKRPVTVSGHADERGTEEYNLVLAEKRATAVKRYLVGLGLEESTLKTVSYGEEKPVDQGHTEEAWRRNRRAELSFR